MKDIFFWDTVYADAAAAKVPIDRSSSLLKRLMGLRRAMRHKQGFACVFWLRVNQHMIRHGWRGHFRLRRWRQYRFANDISPWATIGPGFYLPHTSDIVIGSSAVIGKNATLYNGTTVLGIAEKGLPQLGDNVVMYTGAKIIRPIHIGDNCVLGALALCTKDVPPNHVMYGIPPNVTIKPNLKIEIVQTDSNHVFN